MCIDPGLVRLDLAARVSIALKRRRVFDVCRVWRCHGLMLMVRLAITFARLYMSLEDDLRAMAVMYKYRGEERSSVRQG